MAGEELVQQLGELYKVFDVQHPVETIPEELLKWMADRDIVDINILRRSIRS